jgi:hypothetical protein
MNRRYLFVFCGFPFAGKTTLAKAIQDTFGLPRVDLYLINKRRGIGIKEGISNPKNGKKLTLSVLKIQSIGFYKVNQ